MSKQKFVVFFILIFAIVIAYFVFLIKQENIIEVSGVGCLENNRGLRTDDLSKKLYFPFQFGLEEPTILMRDKNDRPLDSMHPNQICENNDPDDDFDVLEKIISIKFNGLRIIEEIKIGE